MGWRLLVVRECELRKTIDPSCRLEESFRPVDLNDRLARQVVFKHSEPLGGGGHDVSDHTVCTLPDTKQEARSRFLLTCQELQL